MITAPTGTTTIPMTTTIITHTMGTGTTMPMVITCTAICITTTMRRICST